jgi:type III pantothenate kinase
MLLTIDIGNTVVTLGLFDDERLVTTLRVATDIRRQSDEYGVTLTNLLALKGFRGEQIASACLCSVVPPLTVVFQDVCRDYFGVTPLLVSAGVRTGMPILYDSPRDVGADRIADAVAATKMYGAPLIVVDLGTATVFDAVSRDGEYLGGAIAPGINLAADALFLNTSQLRRVELVAPDAAIGRNTTAALQSGLVLGYAGLITGMIARFKKELGQDARVIGTGGLVRVIAREADVFDEINQELTLIGLRIIYQMNQR